MPIELTADQESLRNVGRALKQEADGKKLKKELAANLKQVLEPVAEQARSNLMSIGTAGLAHGGSPLRTAIASQMKPAVRFSGRQTGVALRVRRKNMPRGFTNAPKALSTPKGWRHPVFDSDRWVQQVTVPSEWFDRAARAGHQPAKQAVHAAVESMAQRIADRAK
jgi:hypothetical protein